MSTISASGQIRVLVAAPTPALRAGLRALLASAELQVVGESATLAAITGQLADVEVVVLADADLLIDARGLTEDRRLTIVVLSDDDRAVAALRALPLSGWGIVSLDTSAEDLRATILAAAQGMVVLPLPLAERLLEQRAVVDGLVGPPAEPLTGREREVLELVSQGLSNKLIARRLRISEHTVKFHLSSIFTKLGASSRTDAVSRGARQGLVAL